MLQTFEVRLHILKVHLCHGGTGVHECIICLQTVFAEFEFLTCIIDIHYKKQRPWGAV